MPTACKNYPDCQLVIILKNQIIDLQHKLISLEMSMPHVAPPMWNSDRDPVHLSVTSVGDSPLQFQ